MSVSSQNSLNLPHGIPPQETSGPGDIVPGPIKDVKAVKRNGSLDIPVKMENFKAWSSTAMKCTKQAIEERLGTTAPTRDPEIEAKIEDIKRTQTRYQEISASVKKMVAQINSLAQLEQCLTSQLTMVGQSQVELSSDFLYNAEAQRVNSLSSSGYAAALELFCDGIDTFCKHTVPDVFETVRQLEHARLVYDAFRNDLDRLESKPTAATTTTGTTVVGGGNELRQKFLVAQETYLKLKADTDVKMKLLHENRVRVMRKHLQVLQTATLSFYSSGYQNLENSLNAFLQRNPLAATVDGIAVNVNRSTKSLSYLQTANQSTSGRSFLEQPDDHHLNSQPTTPSSPSATSKDPDFSGDRDVFQE